MNNSIKNLIKRRYDPNVELYQDVFLPISEIEVLQELEFYVGELPRLEQEDLKYSISGWLYSKGHVNHLRLITEFLTILPDLLNDLPYLETLCIKNNSLEDLPLLPDSMRNLRTLIISNCNIRNLPECIRSLPNLENLYIYNLPIESLPEWIGEMFST